MSPFAALAAWLVADATPAPSPSQRQLTEADYGAMPGLLSLAAFVLLAVTIVVIWRSMNKRIKKIDFDEGGSASARSDSSDTPAG